MHHSNEMKLLKRSQNCPWIVWNCYIRRSQDIATNAKSYFGVGVEDIYQSVCCLSLKAGSLLWPWIGRWVPGQIGSNGRITWRQRANSRDLPRTCVDFWNGKENACFYFNSLRQGPTGPSSRSRRLLYSDLPSFRRPSLLWMDGWNETEKIKRRVTSTSIRKSSITAPTGISGRPAHVQTTFYPQI